MTTAQEWIDQTRERLLSGISEHRNRLASAYTAGSGSLAFDFGVEGINKGTRLSIGRTNFYVWSVSQAAQTAEVSAGEDGSPDENQAANSVVRINPRFTDNQIFTELNNELRALAGRGLFQMVRHEFTYTSDKSAFEIDTTGNPDLLREYRVRYQTPSTRDEWPYLNKPLWRLERLANTTDFPSGLALRLMQRLHSGYKVQLLYKAAFTEVAAPSTDVSTTGLPLTAYDLPVLGAYIRMAAPRELKRAQIEAQPNPRRQEGVPPGSTLRAYQGIVGLREDRIAEELAELLRQWPESSV